MSVCDEGWAKTKAPFGMCPAFFEPFEDEGFCELGVFDDHKGTHQPDFCPFAPLLKALPGASEEQREAALKELTRKPNKEVRCKKCEHDCPEDIDICLYHCSFGEMFTERKQGGDEG